MLASALVPIYEYKCPSGHLVEVFHSMSAPSPEVCEVCGEGPLVRVLHPVAVHYKGSGFYSTDYGRGSKKKDAAAASGDSSSSGSSGGSDSSSSPSPSESSTPKKAAEG
jgi:putative FmdB family regulatory protein